MEIAADDLPEGAMTVPTPNAATAIVEALFEDRGRQLWAFGRRLGLDPEECDDAVQEAHLRLLSAVAEGARPDDPAAWLYRAFYRLAMDRHRLARRVRELLGRWPTAPIDGLTNDALELGVWQAVDELPPRQREAVYLHYRADLAFDRVGLVMGITPGGARTHASRGIGTIRRRLSRTEEDDR